ncbi:MAG: cytochrome c [Verrucomicrobiae bacterium]|nr:cytochrome c [Verrucomicrobiae bacterium]
MRYFFTIFFVAVVAVFVVAGRRGDKTTRTPIEIFSDMDHQPKFKTQAESQFFADGRADRMPVEGTVSMEQPVDDSYLVTGKMGDRWGDGFPIAITEKVLERGQERFQISCAICHGATGYGNGIVTGYGLAGVANFHTDRLRTMEDGQIFNTITHGKGLMNGYPQIKVEDRWAIIAYLRALQLSQNISQKELSKKMRSQIK